MGAAVLCDFHRDRAAGGGRPSPRATGKSAASSRTASTRSSGGSARKRGCPSTAIFIVSRGWRCPLVFVKRDHRRLTARIPCLHVRGRKALEENYETLKRENERLRQALQHAEGSGGGGGGGAGAAPELGCAGAGAYKLRMPRPKYGGASVWGSFY